GGITTAMPEEPGGSSPSSTGGWTGVWRTGSGKSIAAQGGKLCSASMSETDPRNGDAGATEPNILRFFSEGGTSRFPDRGTGYRTDGMPNQESGSDPEPIAS